MGYKGSAHNHTVLADTLQQGGLHVPDGRWYLVDAGYEHNMQWRTPYKFRVRYHIKEWAEWGKR
ncbi:hypothetical protein HDU93_005495 [Gonapodya sp. JEL0774]|nr:hypothetical protein HDU93_005495 [Gonapodya sp. JEL0774]